MIFARFLPAFPQNIGAPRRYSSGRPAIDEAIGYYPSALSLNPPSPKDILIKRIKACVETGSWKQVADDASQGHHFASCRSALLKHHYQVIMLDSFAPWGYEMRHAASLKIGDYDNAVEALEQMHSKLAQSRSKHPTWVVSTLSRRGWITHIGRQNIATGMSAHRAHEQRFAKLFNGLSVIPHGSS